ncbi:MAG: hypothetical protein C0494_15825 [Sphingobium sp.]|nr:hypothetical protein [Sphingobium sp.]
MLDRNVMVYFWISGRFVRAAMIGRQSMPTTICPAAILIGMTIDICAHYVSRAMCASTAMAITAGFS